MVARAQTVDLKEIRQWSTNEGHKEKYNVFVQLLKKKRFDSIAFEVRG